MMISRQGNIGGGLNAKQKDNHYPIGYGKAMADELHESAWHFNGRSRPQGNRLLKSL
jgi:hypothetical protein